MLWISISGCGQAHHMGEKAPPGCPDHKLHPSPRDRKPVKGRSGRAGGLAWGHRELTARERRERRERVTSKPARSQLACAESVPDPHERRLRGRVPSGERCFEERSPRLAGKMLRVAGESAVHPIPSSRPRHRSGHPARFHADRTPKCTAIPRNRSRPDAKNRPNNRPVRNLSSRMRQLSPLVPSRSRIPASSAEIVAFPTRMRRPVQSTRSR
jgi:hypothetical protein